jgi:4-aminobutyrate aminotransferase
MPTLWERDHAAISTLQKLRFFPLALIGGEGVYVIDESGRRLLDMSAAWGSASLGYGHLAIRAAVDAALSNPAGASILSATHLGAVELAETLIASLPEIPDARVWFGHSGSDANETAFRAIAAATGRPRVIAFRGAYHGGTAGSMAISGHSVQGHAIRAEGLILLPYPNPYRPTETADDGIALLEQRLATDAPPETIGALFVEPIQSDGGLIVPPPGFLARLVDLCRRHGILVVSDEVKVGLARSGQLHCFRHEGFTPDLICIGKGLGGGLPISALIGPARILNHATAFAMQTLHGNPASVAAAQAVMATIATENLAQNAVQTGAVLQDGLRALQALHPAIGNVRGRGLMIGVELVNPDGSPSKAFAAKVAYRAFELGLVVYYVGLASNVLELTPPLNLTIEQAHQCVDILDRALADVAAGAVSDATVAAFAGW